MAPHRGWTHQRRAAGSVAPVEVGSATSGAPPRFRAAAADWWAVARTPRMLGVLALLLLVAVVFAGLGAWQLDRAQVRGERSAAAELAAQRAVPPVALGDVLAPQTAFPGDLVGRKVVVTGRYEAGEQLLVRGRALGRAAAGAGEAGDAGVSGDAGDAVGSLVLTPVRVADTGALLPVVRGWASDDAAGGARTGGSVPGAAAGLVELVGYLQVGEAASRADDLPAGETDAISPAELANRWDAPLYTGYLVLAEADPGLQTLPPPTRTGAGLDPQNLGYALQWWLFAVFALGVWLRMVRDDARARTIEAAAAGGDQAPGARTEDADGRVDTAGGDAAGDRR